MKKSDLGSKDPESDFFLRMPVSTLHMRLKFKSLFSLIVVGGNTDDADDAD